MAESTGGGRPPVKDPRTIARKYQLEICERAVKENTIVYLGTGCGKTHIAVLLMYELGHLFRKPRKDVCIFLAPTVPLVQQQAIVIENSTDFKVQTYFGNSRHLKNHDGWEKEMQENEVLVMTPQILLQNLRHCFIGMELVALLIFDECHHAQVQKRHPYAQIMKFFKTHSNRSPRIFGMTASPIIGKGGKNQSNYTKCINSLEHLLDAKVYTVVDDDELESVMATPDLKIYFYQSCSFGDSTVISVYFRKLEELKNHFVLTARENTDDIKVLKKRLKLLWREHDNLVYCLEYLGVSGAIQASQILLMGDSLDLTEMKMNDKNNDKCFVQQYLSQALSLLNADGINSVPLNALEEHLFSKKLSVLVAILQKYRDLPNTNCIIFVKRIIVARSLTYILRNLKSLEFWKCEFLVGFHSGTMTRKMMNKIVERFSSGEVNLLVATNVAEEGLDIQTCCLVIRFDLPENVASFIQSRGRARMLNSEYAFLVERGNKREEKLLNEFTFAEKAMGKEVLHRTSNEVFDYLEEETYTVNATGASISTGSSVSLLHHYCAKLPHDQYFKPAPKFYYIDDSNGTVCRVFLPPNSPVRQVDSHPCSSKDDAKRAVCLKACAELHAQGALTDHLLPGPGVGKQKPGVKFFEHERKEDESFGAELHEKLVPELLRISWLNFDNPLCLHLYHIRFTPVPADREYRMFGIFLKLPFPKEAETMEVDLHLAHGRIVKNNLISYGIITFNQEEILLAQKFQEMSLKIILDRSEFMVDFVQLGMNYSDDLPSAKFYLLLPIVQHVNGEMAVDWKTVRTSLSSPVFSRQPESIYPSASGNSETLKLAGSLFCVEDVVNSLVFTPCSNVFYFIDDILPDTNGYSDMRRSHKLTYVEHYKNKFNIVLLHPEQPLLKAKQLFCAHNLLINRLLDNTEVREQEEHFVELPPEICCMKIIGFSKDIGSSLSLLPSLMHRLENLLLAIELKNVLSTSFPEGFEITANRILEALTTEKCLERFSLERLEMLGDAFLKYAVGRHSFLAYGALDEGQLTKNRSKNVNNSNLHELAIKRNLQAYICDEMFDPANLFALGRPCRKICTQDTESVLHILPKHDGMIDVPEAADVKCSRSHRWLQKKTIADAVEALVGAFLVDSGFRAAMAFMQWLGIEVSYEVMDVHRICKESKNNLSMINNINTTLLEEKLGYSFHHKGLLLQAFIHASYMQHSGGCYQRLEFLGDAVIEYLITSYLFSVYPELKPGQLTDLRSITVNNNSFARIAVVQSFHKCLIRDSNSLNVAINKFEEYIHMTDSEEDLVEEPACPKVLGDIVESCIGAVLLDSGFDLKCVWRIMISLLNPVLKFSNFRISVIRELHELCQFCGFNLSFPDPVKEKGLYLVNVNVGMKDQTLNCCTINHSSKTAKRLAAQELLSKLKVRGYKHKSKSLEEILRTTRKGEAELIGFDEEPIVVNDDMESVFQLEKLHLEDQQEDSLCEDEVDMESPSNYETSNLLNYASAKSRLFEICAGNYWNPPSFVCCKEEGLGHLKMFTYKVTVNITGTPSTMLECFGEPQQKKKAAQGHAAEGALWYLKHEGYVRS